MKRPLSHSISSEPAIAWLHENWDAAAAADSYEAFCAGQGEAGQHFLRHAWLPNYWAMIKYRGFLLDRPLMLPKARQFEDLFSDAMLRSEQSRPEGWFILLDYSGTRAAYSGDLKAHYFLQAGRKASSGGERYRTLVQPAFTVPQFLDGRAPHFNVVYRADGLLVTCVADNFIGTEWIALLDHRSSIVPMLPSYQQDMIEAERRNALQGWGGS